MSFFKTFFASILGTIVGLSILMLLFFIVLISSSGESEPYIRSNSVLEIEISGDVPARTQQDPLQSLLFGTATGSVSVEMLGANLEKAAADENIAGVWLKINQVSASWANLEAAYSFLEDYKESGKFLYASTDDIGFNESGWFLASLADSLFSPPVTSFEFNGFAMQNSYYRDLLDKIGVEPEIMRVGEYKSAVEPFLRQESSPEHREQVSELIDDVVVTFLDAAQKKSGLSAEEINRLLEEIPADPVQNALENNLIDVIEFPSETEMAVKLRAGQNEEGNLRSVSIHRYNRVSPSSAGVERVVTSNRIAVLNASGMIIPDIAGSLFSNEQIVTAEGIREALDEILKDDNIRGIVLNINSPGGSASTSDLIWKYVSEAAAEKPVVAYMGEVAASGGYYIAMGADSVIASPNSITGSIGIYSMMFNTEELFEEHLGIHNETITSHDHADIYQMLRPLTPYERDALQRNVEQGYETFLSRVAEARNMSRDAVDSLARGRVWSGRDAADVGLVDATGDLDSAIAMAAGMAGIEEYDTIDYPEQKELLEVLFGSAQMQTRNWISSLFGSPRELEILRELVNQVPGNNWMLLPVELKIR